jgi:hypothetical protein
MDNTTLAYLAGFMDGEGCISLVRSRPTEKNPGYHLIIVVTQLNPEPLVMYQAAFGGSIHRAVDKRGHRPRITWQTSGRNAGKALEALRPFLVVKADEADLALEFLRRVADWAGGDKDAELAERTRLHAAIKAVKQRTYDHIELPKTIKRAQDHSGPRLRMKIKPKPEPKVRIKAAPVKSTGYSRGKRPADAAEIGILAAVYTDHGLAETAREYGVSRQAVLNWLYRYGIPRQGRTPASEARRKAASAASWTSSSAKEGT